MTPQIKYDGQLQISIGRHRRETNWKNKEILWSELVEKISTTHRTAETYTAYLASKKDRQDEIKDVGGFVGGYLTGGKRRASSVLNRCLLTLDIDFGKTDFWEDFTLVYGSAAALYSTHKHSEATPRYRLVMPLSREVFPDEYQAIGRKVAGALGIELFDPSTFQPERLMYWPSTAQDGEFITELQDGPWLDADAVLAEYRDWKDTSQWPVSEKVDKLVKRSMDKQGDPLEKTGVVGAFCRTYSIIEAIDKYLGEVYTPCAVPGRFTYKEGSTSAGLVIYEDKWAYSHHGTDPISGKLCNAFDLVRLHLFGLKDEDARDGTPGNKLPSFIAMLEHATKDKDVRKLLWQEKAENAGEDFKGVDVSEAENVEWTELLEIDKKGGIISNVHNLKTILENDYNLKGKIAYNEFSRKPNVLKPFPWDKTAFTKPREWEDTDFSILSNYLSLKPYELTFTKERLKNVLEQIRKDNSFHPVKNYLNSLEWDGLERIETLFIDYLGAEDNEYTRAVSRKTLVAAVARIFNPGCKFDYVLTLIGDEGIGKSTIYRKLGLEWFTDSFNFNMLNNGKQAYEQMQGYWLIEIPEMTGLSKAEENNVKAFITSMADNYRASHREETLNRARQNILLGTSNNLDFLRAGTGNRRFWPILTGVTVPVWNINRDFTTEEIGQVWAEAVQVYKQGETLYLPAELEQKAREIQRSHTEEHPWKQVIEDYLSILLPDNWKDKTEWERRSYVHNPDEFEQGIIERKKISIKEIWTEGLEGKFSQITPQNKRDITRIMDNLQGWKKSLTALKLHNGDTQKGWVKLAENSVTGGQKTGIEKLPHIYN